jgi:hypothetical protein
MSEVTENIPLKLSSHPESPSSMLTEASKRLNDFDFRIRNSGMEILHGQMRQTLLEEDEELYKEGLGLVLLGLEDENYTVRYYAVEILANVLEQTGTHKEAKEIFSKAAATIRGSTHDEKREVRIFAKRVEREFLSE